MAGMIIFLVVLMLLFCLLLFWWIKQSKPPNYNGFLWLIGGGIEKINRQPEGQKPFYFNYRWYDLLPRWRPLYMWKQTQVEEMITPGIKTKGIKIVHWEPDKPVDYHKIENGGVVKDYITPSELFDNTDWSCARRFETVKSGAMEAVKLGISIAMVAVCIVGIVMMMDMLGKDDDKPVVTSTPEKITMIVEEPNRW
jgi:hypothetical protein